MICTANPGRGNTFGFYVSGITAIVTLITFVIAFLTPPLSGPFCRADCFEYPYSDIAERFPRDYIWMYPAMLVAVLYVAFMLSIHYYASAEEKILSQCALSLAEMAAVVLIINYFVQVSVIQPSVLKGERDGIAILSQYNPHGLFIALEEIGYTLMSLSFMIVFPLVRPISGIHKLLRMTLASGFPFAVVCFTLVTFEYGIMREYVFEVIVISIVWLQLIFASLLFSVVLRKQRLP